MSPTESSKIIEVDVLGNVAFMGQNVAVVTPAGPAAGVVTPYIESDVAHVNGPATGAIQVELTLPDSVRDEEYQITFADTTLEHLTTRFTMTRVSTGDTVYSGNSDFDDPEMEKQIIDGFKIFFNNQEEIEVNTIKWQGNSNLQVGISKTAVAIPIDFEIEFFDDYADTSFSPVPMFQQPVKFKIWNMTDDVQMDFKFNDWKPAAGDTSGGGPDSTISRGDVLTLLAARMGNNVTAGWKLEFSLPAGETPIIPAPGDKLYVTTLKPFSATDIYEFSTLGWQTMTDLSSAMDNIYVVPDPYVAVNALEPKQPAALTGRGERRIEFVNLPEQCTIQIFTVSGKLVKEIEHTGTVQNGREPWDLVTKDGIEIAYGIYFYHVSAGEYGEKTSRFAVIK
jgi:hypothetical protein